MKLTEDFFSRDALDVAPDLVGKILVRRLPDGTELRERIAVFGIAHPFWK